MATHHYLDARLYHQAGLHHQRNRSRVWSYPDDHLFFRTRPGSSGGSMLMHMRLQSVSRALLDDGRDSMYYLGTGANDTSNNGQSLLGSLVGGKEARSNGRLELIVTMPEDVLYEIFSHLHPLDLLHLSRTSWGLRRLLLARHARGVWRAALSSVRALPPCPNDLTEVAYASLAFDNWCHFCFELEVEQISWICRVRCCENCLKAEFISEAELEFRIPEDLFIERPDSIFPYLSPRPTRRGTKSGNRVPLYLTSTANEYLQELDDIVFNKDDKALSQWSERKRDIQAEKLTHAALCEYWATHWAYRAPPRPSPSCKSELGIVSALLVLLAFMWRETLARLYVGVGAAVVAITVSAASEK
ncbi:unnamed protein product [Cyclocybe aegerita]|uniref:F-box domain-containing protein n=1 Tax=Cyclocybe aegerita TaxID=1973307 RepID=A0A8S0WEF2_CYCAE|nr:unnamed protein product [Cyclocybe aegerita]